MSNEEDAAFCSNRISQPPAGPSDSTLAAFGDYKAILGVTLGVCHGGKSYADLSEQRCISDEVPLALGVWY